MNNEEIKLTKYLHNIIEDNMSLRKENDRLWKQKLEYIDRISKVIEFINNNGEKQYNHHDNYRGKWYSPDELDTILEILKGGKEC